MTPAPAPPPTHADGSGDPGAAAAGTTRPPREDPARARDHLLRAARLGLGPALVGYHTAPDGAFCLLVTRAGWRRAAGIVREAGIDRLDFLTCVDRLHHFTLVLQGYGFASGLVVRLRTQVAREDGRVPTVSDLWFLADWEERETYDQFGLTFTGHPDLRRLLNIETWEGHPLRKDYVDRVDIKRPEYF